MTAQQPTVAVLGFPGESSPPGLELVTDLANVQVATTAAELERILPTASVLLVLDFRADLLKEAWPAARQVRWIHAASAGVDNLIFPELRDSTVLLTNARGVFDGPIAEWVLAVMLILCRDLHTTVDLQQTRTWRHRDTDQLAGKHVVVVGAGGIGRSTARLARAVGTTVTLIARTARTDDEFGPIAGIGELDGTLPGADFVVLAAPLTQQTRGLMNAERLALLPSTARLINVGRGELIHTGALVQALRHGRLAGAALDVFDEEPLPASHPLWSLPNVIVSPHMSGDVVGWRSALIAQFADNLRRWLAGEQVHDIVDKAAGYAPTSRGAD